MAAAFPDLTTHLLPLYFIHTGDHDLPLPAIKLATRSLLSLALVCGRQWNTICTPKLYRCLAIDDTTSTGVLLRILEDSQTTADRILPLGSLTRHLIIALPATVYVRGSVNEAVRTVATIWCLRNLGRLARCLPHLQILSISIFREDLGPLPYHGKDFAAAVIETSGHSLLKLHLNHGASVLFSRRELRELLESTPNLVAIIGSGVEDSIGCPVALPYLPKLKYLVVNDVMGHCDRIDHKDD